MKDSVGRDASSGEIWLYDPDFLKVGSWDATSLLCLDHNANDGLKASKAAIRHSVKVPVAVGMMEKAGLYQFVLSFMDSHADHYKNHQVKPALELNQRTQPQALWIWIDGQTEAHKLPGLLWRPYIFGALNWGPKFYYTFGGDPAQGWGRTSGAQGSVNMGTCMGVKFNNLSGAQVAAQVAQAKKDKVETRRTVVFTVTTQALGGTQAEDIARILRRQMTPKTPAVSAINENSAWLIGAPDAGAELYGYSNAVLHELTHLANDKENHCSTTPQPPTCVWRTYFNSNFYGALTNSVFIKGNKETVPWHALYEINHMLTSLRWDPLKP